MAKPGTRPRSEEHTSELQSRVDLVCRLLLEKKKKAFGALEWSRRLCRILRPRASGQSITLHAGNTVFTLLPPHQSPLALPANTFFFLMTRPPPRSTLFPYTTLFR